MKTKQELKEYLLENFVDSNGNLQLSALDFSDFDGDIILCGMKVKNNLDQGCHRVGGTLKQGSHTVKYNLVQNNQIVGGDLLQEEQTVVGDLYQTNKKWTKRSAANSEIVEQILQRVK